MKNEFNLSFQLIELTDLWRSFCEKHTELYEYTCDEYMYLLSSEIDKLDETINNKDALIKEISLLEEKRQETLTNISLTLGHNELENFERMVTVLKTSGHESTASELHKYNLVLLDIIDKIQEQNKKNQIFLNRAIMSLQELRESFAGKKTYKTYSALGKTAKSNAVR